jgi:DNA-binding XRE family transcriptional regulator
MQSMRKRQCHKLNRLWIARKKTNLRQKIVAHLLGHCTTSVISEYETGRLYPNLRTALKLSAIYNTPLSELYGPLYGQVSNEVAAARKELPAMYQVAPSIASRV